MYDEPGYPEPDPNQGHSAIRRRALRGADLPFETDHCHSAHPTVGRRTLTP